MGNLSDSFPMRTFIEIRHLGRFGCRRPAEPIFVSGNGTAPAQSENRVVADPPLLKIQQGIAPKAALMVQPTAARLPTQKQLDLNRVYIPKARSTTRVPADMTRSGAHRGAQAGGEMQLLNSPEFQHGCTEPL